MFKKKIDFLQILMVEPFLIEDILFMGIKCSFLYSAYNTMFSILTSCHSEHLQKMTIFVFGIKILCGQ